MEKQDMDEFPEHGSWHSRCILDFKKTRLYLYGMCTGCGVMQLAGISNYLHEVKEKRILDHDSFYQELVEVKSNGVGALVCTLGQSFYKYEEELLSMGFELLSEYPNYRHDIFGRYKQRMYLFNIENLDKYLKTCKKT
jgi:hypothetical protein